MIPGADFLLGIIGFTQHCGKTKFSEFLIELDSRIGHYETSHAVHLRYDMVYGTQTALLVSEAKRLHQLVGDFADAERLMMPTFAVEAVLNLPRPQIASGMRAIEEIHFLLNAGAWLLRVEPTEDLMAHTLSLDERARLAAGDRELRLTTVPVHIIVRNDWDPSFEKLRAAAAQVLAIVQANPVPPADWQCVTIG